MELLFNVVFPVITGGIILVVLRDYHRERKACRGDKG